jgi:hypothetical protein
MINLSQTEVSELFLKAFLLGVALGIFYDGLRFLRMLFGVRYFGEATSVSRARAVVAHVVTFLCDLVFWLTFGISSILLLYNLVGGVFRFSIYPLMLLGLFLYYISIGKLVLRLSAWVVGLIGKILRALGAFALKILRLVIRLVSVPLLQIKRFFIFLYHLTIGKILGKIKEARILRAQMAALQSDEPIEREREGESRDAGRIYKRDGRISFGR